MAELSEQKQEARAMWAMGDYPSIVHRIEGAGVAAVKAAQIDESDTVLDVACGSGNATIPAAKTGATVTGLDITPELLEAGRANAAEAGVEIDWIEGAPGRRRELRRGGLRVRLHVRPGPRQAAGEIARVLAPGGRIAICAWTPEGSIGRFFMTVAKHMPPPPEGFEPPILWGTEDHVRDLFAGTAVELEFEKAAVDFVADSTGEFMEEYENSLPPTVAAKAALEPQGKWDALRQDILDLYAANNEADDGSFRQSAEFLVVEGKKAD
jgi:SAM-dependent methyltransferase